MMETLSNLSVLAIYMWENDFYDYVFFQFSIYSKYISFRPCKPKEEFRVNTKTNIFKNSDQEENKPSIYLSSCNAKEE